MQEGIGNNIKRLLKEKGLKQTDLASALGISNGTLSDWINGRYKPRPKNIKAMAEFFGVTSLEMQINYNRKDTNPDDRLMSLFNSLPEDKKTQVIDYIEKRAPKRSFFYSFLDSSENPCITVSSFGDGRSDVLENTSLNSAREASMSIRNSRSVILIPLSASIAEAF